MLEAAHELLAAIDGFQAHIDNIHTHLTGTLRLGLFDQSTTNPDALVHNAIRAFDLRAPDVAFEIALAPPGALEARVTDGTLDIAIVPIHRQSSALQYTPLYVEHMTLYCGEGHPLFEQDPGARVVDLDLSKYKYAGYAFNSPNMMAGQNLGIRRAARVQEEEALSLLIQSGRYLGYLADHVAETFLRKGAVRAVAPDDTRYSTRFAAIVRKQPASDRKTQEFLRCLVEAHGLQPSDVA